MFDPSRRAFLLPSASVLALLAWSGAAVSQDLVPTEELFDEPAQNEAALPLRPRPATAAQVVPLTSSFLLNGVTLQYGAKGSVSGGLIGGEDRSTNLEFTGTYALTSSLTEGLEGTLFRRRQAGWYVQLGSADLRRTVTTIQESAGDLIGTRLQITVTGGCVDPASEPGALCTFTPGLSVDPASIDPQTLLPGRFITDSEYGGRISQETYEALQADGFQRGVVGGEEVVGLDLDFLNNGFTLDLDRAERNSIRRREEIESRPLLSFSRVVQNLYSNDTNAALDRTIRSVVLLREEEWTDEALVLQAAAWLLPAADARLAGGAGAPDLSISNNLFLSANNLRLPEDSLTAYQSGISWVEHSATPPRSAAETPVAWSNAVWLGFSPVRDNATSNRIVFDVTGPRQTVQSDYYEGGLGSGFDDVIGGQITIIDEIDGQISELDFAAIDDLYVQVGVDITRQEAVQRLINEEVWTTHYVPHLSFTGNRTSGLSVLRYYGGVLLPDDPNAYVGADYTVQDERGWSAYAGAQVYSNPDEDYYSQVTGSLSRRFELAENQRLTLGFVARTELDRPEADGTSPTLSEGDTSLDLLASYSIDDLDLTLRQRFADLDRTSSTNSSTIAATYQASPRLTLTAEYTPCSEEDSFVRARAGLELAISDEPGAPTLRAQWARAEYDYGTDAAGQRLETSQDSFLAAIQMRF